MTSLDGMGRDRGIVLDAVGTLIEPEPPVARAYADGGAPAGAGRRLAEVKRRFRRHFRNDEVDERRGPLATDEGIETAAGGGSSPTSCPTCPTRRAFAELWDHSAAPRPGVFPDVGPGLAGSARRASASGSPRTSTAGSGRSPPACPSWPGSARPW